MDRRDARSSRRRFLALAAGGALTAVAGCTNLRIKAGAASGARPASRFRFAAEGGEWLGVAPDQIRDERNPILRTTPGEPVEVTWANRDGEPHRFVVEGSDGRALVESPPSAERGATRTVTFDATQEMTEYLDPHNPVLMRGPVLVTRS